MLWGSRIKIWNFANHIKKWNKNTDSKLNSVWCNRSKDLGHPGTSVLITVGTKGFGIKIIQRQKICFLWLILLPPSFHKILAHVKGSRTLDLCMDIMPGLTWTNVDCSPGKAFRVEVPSMTRLYGFEEIKFRSIIPSIRYIQASNKGNKSPQKIEST